MVKRTLFLGFVFLVASLTLGVVPQDHAESIQDIYAQAMASTVLIQHTHVAKNIYGQDERARVAGSGVLIRPNQILTCYHIFVSLPAGKVEVFLYHDGDVEKRTEIIMVKFDSTEDLALLQVSPPFSVRPRPLADNLCQLGDDVFFTGFSSLSLPVLRFIKYMPNYSMGIMVYPMYFGDSGGGVFDNRGRLIGIIRLVLAVKKPIEQSTLIGYAIPLPRILEFLK